MCPPPTRCGVWGGSLTLHLPCRSHVRPAVVGPAAAGELIPALQPRGPGPPKITPGGGGGGCDGDAPPPHFQNGRSVSKRGVSCQFGPDVTKSFLERNRLDYIIRSHEVKPEGYEVAHDGKCVTVFSAPNYW